MDGMTVDVAFLSQLIDAMEEAILKLERAVKWHRFNEANELRTFIFDLHKKIEEAAQGGHGGNHV